MGHNELGDLFYAQGDLQVGDVGAAPAAGAVLHLHGAQRAGWACHWHDLKACRAAPAAGMRFPRCQPRSSVAAWRHHSCKLRAASQCNCAPPAERVQALHAHARLLHHWPPCHPYVPARWVGGWAVHTCVWWYSFVCLGVEHMFGC